MIRGTKRKIMAHPDKRFDVGTSIHNRFDIEVIDAISGKVKDKAYAENVICNNLWTRLFNNQTYNNAISYGDGTGIPSENDTSLFSHLGSIESTRHKLDYDYDNNVFICTKRIVIDEQTAVNKTISEVGIAYSTSSSALVTHAMLKDMNGNLVSLHKTDTDIFNVYATIYCHISLPSNDVRVLGTYLWNKSYNTASLLAWIAGIYTFNELYLYPACHRVYTRSAKTITKTSDLSTRTITFGPVRLASNEYNSIGGICTLYLAPYYSSRTSRNCPNMVFEIGPGNLWYEESTIKSEPIGTGDGQTKDFATAFPYAKDVTIYVDGRSIECTVDSINHKLSVLKDKYPGLSHPLFSYFKLIQQPECCYAFYDSSIRAPSVLLPYRTESQNGYYIASGTYEKAPVYENPLCETYGVKQIYRRALKVEASNDLANFVTICEKASGHETITVPEEYQHYRYWRINGDYSPPDQGASQGTFYFISTDDDSLLSGTNIHLKEAPTEGSVITADYKTESIAKDENHVFDFSVVFRFNEHTEVQ